jgi:hypothetical protein
MPVSGSVVEPYLSAARSSKALTWAAFLNAAASRCFPAFMAASPSFEEHSRSGCAVALVSGEHRTRHQTTATPNHSRDQQRAVHRLPLGKEYTCLDVSDRPNGRRRVAAGILHQRPPVRGAPLFWAILALGIFVRVAMLVLLDVPLKIRFAEMEQIARSLAVNGAFADPYSVPTGLTAHHAPVYPFLLSLVFRTFGFGAAAAFAMAVMNFTFASLQWALMPFIAERGHLPRSVGITAGVIGALLPYRFFKETVWESALVGAATACLVLVTLRWMQSRPPSVLHTVGVGVAWGVGIMCSASLLPVFFVTMVVVVVRTHPGRSMWIGRAAIATAAMVAALAPWTIRNYIALQGPVLMRSNFGIEFSLSNNPQAHVLLVDNYLIGYPDNHFHRHHPWSNRGEARRVAREGEVAYNRRRVQETLEWIRANPRQFASLTAGRLSYFWFTPYKTQFWKNFVLTPWTLLAVYGLWLMVRRRSDLGLLLLALWIGFPLVYYLVQTDTRYRYPIEWTFMVLGMYSVYTLAILSCQHAFVAGREGSARRRRVSAVQSWLAMTAAPQSSATPAETAPLRPNGPIDRDVAPGIRGTGGPGS